MVSRYPRKLARRVKLRSELYLLISKTQVDIASLRNSNSCRPKKRIREILWVHLNGLAVGPHHQKGHERQDAQVCHAACGRSGLHVIHPVLDQPVEHLNEGQDL